jgi:DNA-binding GntR family transcriptional regulator
MVEQILPSTISTHIFEDLRRRIIEGDYAPGQPLREEEIRELHGSSRGPIRESLRMLLQTGLVEHQPRRGFRVREYSERDIRQIYALRATLEAQVVGELVGRDLAPLLEKLDNACNVMRDCYEQSNLEAYFDENRRFHQTIIDFADNRVLREVMEYVNEVSLPIRYRILGDALPSRRSLTYHEEIVAHLRAGHVFEAQTLTQQHILENLERAIMKYGRRRDLAEPSVTD